MAWPKRERVSRALWTAVSLVKGWVGIADERPAAARRRIEEGFILNFVYKSLKKWIDEKG
jgi:hypothetical protein